MQVLLLGAGTVTSRLNMVLAEQGHSVVAQIAALLGAADRGHAVLYSTRILKKTGLRLA
jgi:hypothetical protein